MYSCPSPRRRSTFQLLAFGNIPRSWRVHLTSMNSRKKLLFICPQPLRINVRWPKKSWQNLDLQQNLQPDFSVMELYHSPSTSRFNGGITSFLSPCIKSPNSRELKFSRLFTEGAARAQIKGGKPQGVPCDYGPQFPLVEVTIAERDNHNSTNIKARRCDRVCS